MDPQLDPDVAAKLTTATIALSGGMTADAAYNVICERAGLDVIFDPRFEPQKMWEDFWGFRLRDALELVGKTSRTAWRVVAPHTIVVVPVQSPHPNPNPPKMSRSLEANPDRQNGHSLCLIRQLAVLLPFATAHHSHNKEYDHVGHCPYTGASGHISAW